MTSENPIAEVTQDTTVLSFTEALNGIGTLDELVNHGAQLFSISYIDSVIKRCWGPFSRALQTLAPEDHKRSVIAVDLPAIFHASFAKSGEGAATDTLSRVESVVNDVNEGSEIIITMDSPCSKRRDSFPGYKASRQPKPAEFNQIREEAIANLTNNGFRVVSHDGWESDDVMASVSFRAKLRRQSCVIITDDRDLLQCCGSGTTCFSPRTHEYHSEQWLAANYSITPKQVVDWLCMVGKDDAPSVPGVGEKIAAELLASHGSFWGIYDSVPKLVESKKLSVKKATAITEFGRSGNYFVAKDLHTLNRSLEVHW